MRSILRVTAFAAVTLSTCALVEGHSGRRFNIEVVDGKLRAQGVNTGPSDGAPSVRPYTNSIHSHWTNIPSLGIATSTLPGFDIPPSSATTLLGSRLDLEWLGVSRWVSPVLGTTPVLEPLDAADTIRLTGPSATLDSDSFGTLTLVDDVLFGGTTDIDPFYEINATPAGEIQVLEFRLHAIGVDVASSDSIYVLLSPDGANPMERLHHASLFLEEFVATVPEPTTAVLTALVLSVASARRR